ncbi:MAG: ferredoxin:glutaredoxin reductase [Candidatus Bipolaricaulota bacterium]|nr:ferredoxin:glutaredoxin reductase [Candidatus Bipolaricaulota bacterium]
MSGNPSLSVDAVRAQLERDAESAGYQLNPDLQFVRDLVEGLLKNRQRYGYPACPCRLASGVADEDRDIVCPCDYRDADLVDWGSCYCGLYVSGEIRKGEKTVAPVPERRPPKVLRTLPQLLEPPRRLEGDLPVWRCRVCGYLCARERPPAVCPICKATADRFELFG